MFKTNTLTAFFAPILCIISFSSFIFINARILDVSLGVRGVSYTYFDSVTFYMMIGYILASFVMVLFIHRLSFFGRMMIAFLLYYFSYLGIMFLNIVETKVMLYFMMHGAGTMMLVLLLVNRLVELYQVKIIDSLIFVILAAFLSYIVIVHFDIFVFEVGSSVSFKFAVIVNIVSLSLFIVLAFFIKNYKKERDSESYNFEIVIKNMEIEMLLAFYIFYVLMSVKNGYEVFSLSHYMHDLSIANSNFIIFASVFIALILTKFIVKGFNIHKVNIICLVCLLVSFLLLPIVGDSLFALNLVLLLLGIFTGVIFFGTTTLMVLKFEGINLASATTIYALAASIGYYCGYITIDTAENTLGSEGFLISICFVLVGLLIYYLFLFKKLKLYR
jgi:hypothetical protein